MKTISVMGGNGVICYPFKNHLLFNAETRKLFHTKDNEQWVLNFKSIPYYKEKDFLENVQLNDLDVLIGAPDCGHSSALAYSRAKKLSNPRDNESLTLFIKSVLKYNPKVFLMENLPKLLVSITKEDFENTFKNYSLIFHTQSVSEFGNSQKTRIRLIIIGINKEYFGKDLELIQYHFSKIYKVSKLKTCGELTGDLKKENLELGNIREDINSTITLYAGFRSTLYDIRDYWRKNPTKKRITVHGRNFTTAPGVYRNLFNDYPSTARKANRQYNHNGLQLTPRELARIQGIPDRFKIFINPKNKMYWINKARTTVTKCPPFEIGYWFYKQCKHIFK